MARIVILGAGIGGVPMAYVMLKLMGAVRIKAEYR